MATLLHIETSARICSVAVAKDGSLLSLRESATPNAHSSLVTVFIGEVVHEAGLTMPDLDAVAISMGPGSYTGLRIGTAAAKGLCFGLDKPLVAVPTLQAMALGMSRHQTSSAGNDQNGLFCPMLDARRMEVYCALFDAGLKEIRATEAVVVDEDSFARELQEKIVLFGGEGADKCIPVLEHHPNARFISHFETSARFMIPLALERFRIGRFEDPASFEPYYLKEFVAGKPRVKGLYK